ncbi:GlxA family transcriptional regulator [Paraburkholderia sp. DHOC27]|uniref:GlxA family transcriptional regulator n=1 Tax=Paraburkholderia sp. DHOC27 TaxID=2303330 RepID=UPI000E3D33DA|nr:helix-turn-helix domain-containing protein [Paraburkholderia sp. DHOC27]RFU44550.1 helix-turn-helix domain-containing protein [Paraburkholderia sp. DHOC27]
MLRIGLVLSPGFGVMSLCTMSVFDIANIELGQKFYDVHLISEYGGPMRSSMGAVVETEQYDDSTFDTLITCGTGNMPCSPAFCTYLRATAARTRRIGATCRGAFALAEAGVLNGVRVTTHWSYAADFRRRFPQINLDENRLYIADGSIWTSAGMTASIDQSLAMVEKDLGFDLAKAVAKTLNLAYRRSGAQPQASALLDIGPRNDRMQCAIAYARANLHKSLSVEELARVAHLSPRQFARVFRTDTGMSPAKAIEKMRIEAARLLVQDGRHSIEHIARQTGFGKTERMRRAFIRVCGTPPQGVRRDARVDREEYDCDRLLTSLID